MAQAVVVTVMTVIVIALFFMCVGLFLFYLHWRNSHPKPSYLETLENKKVKMAIFIIKDIVLPLIGLAFFIIAVIGFQNKKKWKDLDVHAIAIAFYFFQSLKYLIIIFSLVTEHFETLDDKITQKLARFGVRADWKELIEGFIFIPSVIVDGMLINAEFYVGDDGNAFNGDGIVMLVIDTVLWVMLCCSLLLQQYSSKDGEPPFQIKEFAYALFIFFYSVLLVFFFIVEHKRVIHDSKMKLTTPLIIILVNALTHAYVCSYSSMMAQGITMFDKALRGSQARVTQLRLFINYLRFSLLAIFATIVFLGYTIWLYVSVWIYTMNGLQNIDNDNVQSAESEGLIRAVYIMVQIFTGVLCINLLYAILKRLGGYAGWNGRVGYLTFDCSIYAEKINSILSECTANFHLDHRAQVVVTGAASSPRSPAKSPSRSHNRR